MKKRSRYNNLFNKDKEENLRKLYEEGQSDNIGKRFVYFLVGLALFCGGLFLIFQNTILSTRFTLMDIIGFTPPFGVVLLPFIIGVGVFFNGDRLSDGY